MPSYDELKSELTEIAKTVEKFPEQVKPQVYELLVSKFLGKSLPLSTSDTEKNKIKNNAGQLKTPKKKDKQKSKAHKTSGKESYSIDRNLNVRGDEKIQSFKVFNSEKSPNSAMQFNAVAIYYLEKLMGMKQVTLEHVYTCYAEANRKPPKHFRQSFTDTKNQRGWIELDSDGNLNIPHRGVVFVEHDLPKKKKDKE